MVGAAAPADHLQSCIIEATGAPGDCGDTGNISSAPLAFCKLISWEFLVMVLDI